MGKQTRYPCDSSPKCPVGCGPIVRLAKRFKIFCMDICVSANHVYMSTCVDYCLFADSMHGQMFILLIYMHVG